MFDFLKKKNDDSNIVTTNETLDRDEIEPESQPVRSGESVTGVQKEVTRADVEQEFEDRFTRINKEVRDGLSIVKDLPKSVSIFGSARLLPAHPMYVKASSLAKKISEEGFAVISGGGPGIMEAANCGAKEGKNGASVGFNIKLPYEQHPNTCATHTLDFHYFFSRKLALTFSAEAYIYFPGGFGTFDEFFEILTLVQTKKIEQVPIILVGEDFWRPLDALIKNLLRDTYKTIDVKDTDLYLITDDEEVIMNIIRNAKMRIE